MSPYVNRTRPRVPTELTVPMSAVSTPRARGGLCLKGRNLSWVGGGRVAVAWANGRASLDFAFQRTYYFSCRRLVCRPPARHAMSVGPGPTHGRSNLSGLTQDLLLALPPDAGCMLPFGLFVVCVWGGFLQGRRLGGLCAVLAVPSVVPVLVQHLQDSTLSRWV